MDSKREPLLKNKRCVSCSQIAFSLYLVFCFLYGYSIGAKQDHHHNTHKKIIKEMNSNHINNDNHNTHKKIIKKMNSNYIDNDNHNTHKMIIKEMNSNHIDNDNHNTHKKIIKEMNSNHIDNDNHNTHKKITKEMNSNHIDNDNHNTHKKIIKEMNSNHIDNDNHNTHKKITKEMNSNHMINRNHNTHKKIKKEMNSNHMDEDNHDTHEKIIREMDSEHIRNLSKHYTEFPHRAGSWRNEMLGREMAKVWKEYGFDKTEIFEHRILLSSPKRPTEIYLMEHSKVKRNITISNEPSFGSSEEKGNIVYPTIAFSASANIVTGIVYCNYGSLNDYNELKKLNIQTHDRIFLMRTGSHDSRKELIERAIQHGAKAIIFFPDPRDRMMKNKKYPKGYTLNEYGVLRRKAQSKFPFDGDLLSIGYPSKKNYFRANASLTKDYYYKIPFQTISAATTTMLFDFMDDVTATNVLASFKGGLKSNYSLQSGMNKTIRLVIENELKDNISYTVCGSLFGSIEPDRYVVLGNHRDAWTYGAMDPGSGSSVMTEIVRVLGKYKKEGGYRPRRSIMVCSWDAEEQGLQGSTEWADENSKFISQNAIAYLNVDVAVEGNYTVKLKSSDQMIQVIWESMRTVNPTENNTINLFQDTCHKQATSRKKNKDFKYPLYKGLGFMSDNAQFSRYGLGVSDYRYTYDDAYFPEFGDEVGTYHTRYDSFDWMKKFVDPTFRHHLTLGKLWLTHALILADRKIIPFDLRRYVDRMKSSFTDLEIKYEPVLNKHGISLKFAKSRIRKLIKQVIAFQKTVKDLKTKKTNFYITRAINDRISNLSKQFQLKTNVGATTLQQIYYNNEYRGIRAALTKSSGTNADNINKEITLLVWCVDMAIDLLDISELRLDGQ